MPALMTGYIQGDVNIVAIRHNLDYTQGKTLCQSFMKFFMGQNRFLCNFSELLPLYFKLRLSVEGNAQMLIGKLGDTASSGSPG